EGAIQILEDFQKLCKNEHLSDDRKIAIWNNIAQKAYEGTADARKFALAANTLVEQEIKHLADQCEKSYDTTLSKLSKAADSKHFKLFTNDQETREIFTTILQEHYTLAMIYKSHCIDNEDRKYETHEALQKKASAMADK